MFQIFLNEFSRLDSEEFKILILDNGAFHHGKTWVIPDKIALVFLPPYNPELNPAEKVWWRVKRELENKIFKTMDELQEFLNETVKKIVTRRSIKQLTSFSYYEHLF